VISVLTVPVAMPVLLEISEAVIGPASSASSTLALFCPRGARPDAVADRARPQPGRVGRRSRGPTPTSTAADLRSRRTLEPAQRVAQPRQLIAEPLMSRELAFDVPDPRLYLLDDRAHIRHLRHIAPALGFRRPS
jgi:hypothetical protein